MASMKRDGRTERTLHTPIDMETYNAANGARVVLEITWQEVISAALLLWMERVVASDGQDVGRPKNLGPFVPAAKKAVSR